MAKTEKSGPGFKTTKDRLTLILGENAERDFKFKPFLIYQSKNPRAMKNAKKATFSYTSVLIKRTGNVHKFLHTPLSEVIETIYTIVYDVQTSKLDAFLRIRNWVLVGTPQGAKS